MEACEKIRRIKRLKAKETLSRMIRRTRRVAAENNIEVTEEHIRRVARKMFDEWNQALDEKLAEALRDGLSGL